MGGFRVIIHKMYTLKRTNKLSVWLQVLHKTSDTELPSSTFFTMAERSLDFRRYRLWMPQYIKLAEQACCRRRRPGPQGLLPWKDLSVHCHPNQADKIAEVGTY